VSSIVAVELAPALRALPTVEELDFPLIVTPQGNREIITLANNWVRLLEAFCCRGTKGGIQAHHAAKLLLLLTALDYAKRPEDTNALFTEAINAYLAGDTAEGKAILRDLVNATVGFEGLAAAIKKPSKSLHRMLAPRGNPSNEHLFGIVSSLKKAPLKLRATAKEA
jgi:hypothetical protein